MYDINRFKILLYLAPKPSVELEDRDYEGRKDRRVVKSHDDLVRLKIAK